MTTVPQLGAPGLYFTPVRQVAAPEAVHLDEVGFVGIAPRGPVNRPVKVTSWSDFLLWFGGLPGSGDPPTLLAFSVQTFFAQGGRAAWIVRVGPADSICSTAGFVATGQESLRLEAANEGAWGNSLSITLEFAVAASFRAERVDGPDDSDWIEVPDGVVIPNHSLLRIGGALQWVTAIGTDVGQGERRTRFALDRPIPPGSPKFVGATVITGTLVVVDNSKGRYTEKFKDLGLHPDHPRFVPKVIQQAAVLGSGPLDRIEPFGQPLETSSLVSAPQVWSDPVLPDDRLQPLMFRVRDEQRGVDRWTAIDRRSFFDDDPANADPLDEDLHRGVDAIGRVDEIGLVCVPDLAWRWTPPETIPSKRCRPRSAEFVPQCTEQPLPVAAIPVSYDVWLDPSKQADLDEIVSRQKRAVDVAELRKRFVLLLDVPVGLPPRDIARWRTSFGSSFAAAYHPWLAASAGSSRADAVVVPPSAFAAGIISSREIRLGVHRGPANELAVGGVRASNMISEDVAAQLVQFSINVFRPERDGFRLQSARTLSTDPLLRQLNVRRLMTTLFLVLRRIGDRLVFEPNTSQMRSLLVQTITSVLTEYHHRGALAGSTEAESFFVACDDRLNTPQSVAQGQLIAEVGIAPVEPMEFIVVRIVQTADGAEVIERG